jgi:hypothetical protein
LKLWRPLFSASIYFPAICYLASGRSIIVRALSRMGLKEHLKKGRLMVQKELLRVRSKHTLNYHIYGQRK